MWGDMITFTVITDALGYKSNWDISDFPANSRARFRKIDFGINKGNKSCCLQSSVTRFGKVLPPQGALRHSARVEVVVLCQHEDHLGHRSNRLERSRSTHGFLKLPDRFIKNPNAAETACQSTCHAYELQIPSGWAGSYMYANKLRLRRPEDQQQLLLPRNQMNK